MHAQRCTHNAPLDGRHLRTCWVAAPQCQPTNADSRRGHIRTTLTTGPAGLPHPATRASLPDTGAWTIGRNCPIAQVQYTLYNGAALSAVRFLLIHYRKPSTIVDKTITCPNLDIDDSTWSAPPPSLFVNMSRAYSVNTVNRLTGLFPHG